MQIVRSPDTPAGTSYLFLVRLWRREPENESFEEREWEGKVQNVRSGQAHGFEHLPALVEALQSLLGDAGPASLHTIDDPEFHRNE